MTNNKTIFGWKTVFQYYSLKDFFYDSIIPIVVAIIICFVIIISKSCVFDQLKHLVDVGISIIPSMIALLLAAYAIILTLLSSNEMSILKSTTDGKKLAKSINANFASCILISIITIIVLFIISSIANMNIRVEYSSWINYPTLFIVCFLIVFSVFFLINIVIDIFNSTQIIFK